MRLPDQYYCGQIKESWKHGRGVYVKADSTFDYVGDFVDDRKEGKGVLILGPDFKEAWVGTWRNDKVEGEVLIVALPECSEVKKAIFRNDKKVAQVPLSGP